ncbi:MAG TPA: zinc-dependent metalloprotease [Acidimicrobiales bacterium]|nr:zinc-dependent metalloprotease [Acidimicrobiales bacterium]
MSDPGPFGDDPFSGIPFLGDLSKMMGGQGPVAWDAARQLAMQLATDGESEPNVEPLERIKLEELARVAELRVAASTGLDVSTTGRSLTVVPVTRAQWVHKSLDAYKPLFDELGGALAEEATDQPPGELDAMGGDPMAAMIGPLMKMLGPMMLGMTAGSMLGHLAQRSFGQYDLPIPRPPSDELLLVPSTIEAFGNAWSLDGDDLRLWICLHEIAHHAVLGIDHVRTTLQQLLFDYAGGFSSDASGLENRLPDIDPTDSNALAGLQEMFSDPEVVLGAIVSPAQLELQPRLAALTAVIAGYVDHVMDDIGATLIGSYGMLTEALRRRRVESAPSDRFVERLLGLELDQAQYDRGAAFVDGIVERAGPDALRRLWSDERRLPTPAEVDAPGLWLARIELPDEEN